MLCVFDFQQWDQDRIAQRMILIDVARRAGVSPSYVSKFVHGERRSVRMCRRMAEALGYPLVRYQHATRSS